MKNKKRGLVETQPLDEMRGTVNSYHNFTASHDNEESALANPDILPEQPTAPSSPQLLMGEAVQHLQGRQKEVYLLVMREDKSLAEAAEILEISKSTVQTYLDRAIAFITAYCQQAMDQERI
jgi:RNA polymerase sigma factor (sigma-70 family)